MRPTNSPYDRQILQILSEVGERGISAQLLSKHVYNMNCTLFSSPDFEEVRSYVRNFILRNSKSTKSLIERTGRWGYYRLNTRNNSDARQLLLSFREKPEAKEDSVSDEQEAAPTVDLSLNLFD